MEPVRVKVYGVMSMTRRGYLMQLCIAIVFAAILLILWSLRWPKVKESLEAGQPSPVMQKVIAFWDRAPWVLSIICVLLAVEAWFVLRRFAQKEAERKRQPPSVSA